MDIENRFMVIVPYTRACVYRNFVTTIYNPCMNDPEIQWNENRWILKMLWKHICLLVVVRWIVLDYYNPFKMICDRCEEWCDYCNTIQSDYIIPKPCMLNAGVSSASRKAVCSSVSECINIFHRNWMNSRWPWFCVRFSCISFHSFTFPIHPSLSIFP